MKSNNIPTTRIKFSKIAFLNTCIFKYAIKHACSWIYRPFPTNLHVRQISATFVRQDKSSEKSFHASWHTNRTWLHNDEANILPHMYGCLQDGKLNSNNLDKAFIINRFSNWKDASVAFKRHDSSKCNRY